MGQKPDKKRLNGLDADLAELAHELRTPLSAISAASEIMKDERFGPVGDRRYHEYARDIHESVQLALGMIDRMLYAHAMGDGRGEGSAEPINVAAVIDRIVSSMRPLAEARSVTLMSDCAEDTRLHHLLADEIAIKQILLNLINNSIKFTSRGGNIFVGATLLDDGGLSLFVRDTGAGLSAEEFRLALDGHSIGVSKKANEHGFGLGLPLVKALSEANGGRVSLSASCRPGTTIEIRFEPDRVISNST